MQQKRPFSASAAIDTAANSGILFRLLLAGFMVILLSAVQPASGQTYASYYPGQYLDFDTNKLEIVITPDHFPIIWRHAQKYGIDLSDTTGVMECTTVQPVSTPGGTQYIYTYYCPSAATAAGAVYFKQFNVPGYGTVTVYYNASLQAIGSGADLDSDDIGDSQDDDIDGDGVDNANDEYPRDPDLWNDDIQDSDGDGSQDAFDAYPFDPTFASIFSINTAGAFSVAPSGAASYSFPIEAPPGIAGMAPKLSLNYNSQGGNGLLGLGWSLGGFSTIHRCPSTIAQDGTGDGVDFDGNDKFCLDGQRLLVTVGTYGAVGSEYRTELDAFTKVIVSGTPLSGTGSFTVKTPTGEVMEYGVTTDSRIMAEGKSKAYVWALNKVTDSSGNYMTFTYAQNAANSEYWPTRIDYAYAGGVSHARVEFEYGTRADVQTTYMAGSVVRLTKFLTRIHTYSDSTQVMQYVLNYGSSPLNGRKRLISIIPCSLVTGLKCLTPMHFEWQGQKQDPNESDTDLEYASRDINDEVGFDGSPHWTLDTDGDGRQELLYGKANSNQYKYIGQSSGSYWGLKGHTIGDPLRQWTVDINGDGLMDLLYKEQSSTAHRFWVLENKGNGTTQLKEWGTSQLQYIALDGHGWPVDINGDGRTDLVYVKGEFSQWEGIAPTVEYYALITQLNGTATEFYVGSRIHELGLEGEHFTFDVNGDGATDLIYNEAGTYNYRVLINNRNNTFTDDFWVKRSFDAAYDYAHWPMDANGDGLVDLVYKSGRGNQYRVLKNKGDGDAVDDIFGYQSHSPGWNGKHWVLDVNADGIMDLVYNQADTNNYRALISQANGTRVDQKWAEKSNSVGFNGNHWSADVDGDGLSELLYNSNGSNVYRKLTNRSEYDLIDRITDGFGNTTTIAYAPMSSGGTAYTRTVSAYNQYPNNLLATGALQVVDTVTVPDGVGGTRTSTYDYTDFRVSREGRGMLGFRKMIEEDLASKVVKTTTFMQSYPYTGMPEQVLQEVRLTGGGKVQFNRKEIDYATEPQQPTQGVPVFVYPSVTEEYSYHFDNATSTSALLATTTTTNSNYLGYGNFGTVTVEIQNVGATQKYKTITTNQFDNYTGSGKWILGLLRRAQVTKYVNDLTDANSTTVTAFEYDSNTGLLKKEIIEPDRPAPYRTVTAYARDGFGNITIATVCASDFGTDNGSCEPGAPGPGALPYRTTETDYDAYGQFPESVTNALEQGETYVYERKFGRMLSLTGPNQLTTSWQYDAFGRKTGETRADGTSTSYEYEWCVSGCPANGKHFTETTSTGSAPAKVYFDAFDRKLRAHTIAFDGGNVYVDTLYNALGQTQKVSEPYFPGGTIYWTESEYDLVGRVVEITPPAGPVVTTVYNGLSNTTSRIVNGSARTEIETRNVAGQTVRVTNAAGVDLVYTYDSQGNLVGTQVEDTSNNLVAGTLIEVDFDIRGRKISMDDPDMGEWSYAYNGYGELVSQTNALGQTVTMTYDKLGRMQTRTEPEGASSWTYGDQSSYTSTNRNIGKLIATSGPGGLTGKNIYYDSLGRPKDTVTSITVIPYDITNQQYTTSMTYYASGSHIGKLDKIQYPTVGGTRFEVKHNYNAHGYLESVTSPNGSVTYWEGVGTNARGQFTSETLGDHVLTTRSYDAPRGWTKTIQSVSDATGVGTFQNMEYQFDDVGNIVWRKDHRQSLTENFLYDTLDQITDAWVVGGTPSSDYVAKEYEYDILGNITFKTGVGHYKYGSACATGAAGPHAVCEIRSAASGGTLLQSYAYNANGSMVSKSGGVQEVSYTSFNKPYLFKQNGTESVAFRYGVDRERIFKAGGGTKTIYIGMGDTGNPLYEHEMTASVQKHLHFIYAGGQALGVYTVQDNGGTFTNKTEYLRRDHLGSVEVVTAQNGTVAARMSYDAWGQQRDPDWSEPSGGFAAAPGNLGFTGHENITEVGLIHMNGRVYDPVLGKFLSADPNVQFSKDVRSYNRYAYVNNNPLRYTDPTGYFLKKILKEMSPALATILSVAFTAMGLPTVSILFNGMYASANGATNGQIAFNMALSAVGNELGKAVTANMQLCSELAYDWIQGAVSGAFTGGVNAAVTDGNIFRGIVQGAASGAAMSALAWKIKQSVINNVTQITNSMADQGHVAEISLETKDGIPIVVVYGGLGTSEDFNIYREAIFSFRGDSEIDQRSVDRGLRELDYLEAKFRGRSFTHGEITQGVADHLFNESQRWAAQYIISSAGLVSPLRVYGLYDNAEMAYDVWNRGWTQKNIAEFLGEAYSQAMEIGAGKYNFALDLLNTLKTEFISEGLPWKEWEPLGSE